MIHNTYLVRISTLEILAHTQYWPVDVVKKDVDEFITTREDLRKEDPTLANFPLIIGDDKFHGRDLSQDIIVVFVTDKGEDEGAIGDRLGATIKALRSRLVKSDILKIKDQYEEIIEASIITRLKIALVGEGGVGKTTTLHLLMGDTPPLQYVPTIALNLETVENIRFGNYSLVLWDFAGQERFRNLWKFYFHGADVIFLVCDSSLRNVIISKDILKLIKRDAPKVPVFALANKQDKPNAMRPEVVQKILGIPTYPMVAIDKSRRDEMLRILMTAAAQFVGVVLPDLPASELLRFTDEATAAMSEQGSEGFEAISDEEEYEEEYEEVFVDEEGHVISAEELGDDSEYEIVEEIVEFEEAESVDQVPSASEELATEEFSKSESLVAEELVDEFEEIPLEASGPEEELVPIEIEESEEIPLVSQSPEESVDETLAPSGLVEVQAESTSLADPDDMSTVIDELFQTPVESGTDDSRKIAKDLISEALDADDIISAEIDRVSRDELDIALEAFSSEEVICPDGEVDEDARIADETLKELEIILGVPDEPVTPTKSSEGDDFDEELDALDELFALMSENEDDSSDSE